MCGGHLIHHSETRIRTAVVVRRPPISTWPFCGVGETELFVSALFDVSLLSARKAAAACDVLIFLLGVKVYPMLWAGAALGNGDDGTVVGMRACSLSRRR